MSFPTCGLLSFRSAVHVQAPCRGKEAGAKCVVHAREEKKSVREAKVSSRDTSSPPPPSSLSSPLMGGGGRGGERLIWPALGVRQGKAEVVCTAAHAQSQGEESRREGEKDATIISEGMLSTTGGNFCFFNLPSPGGTSGSSGFT